MPDGLRSELLVPGVTEPPTADDLAGHPAGVIIRPMLTTDRAIDLFVGDLARRGYSDRTRTTYSHILDKLCERLPRDQDVSKITIDDCRRFLDLWNHRSSGTRAHQFSVLSSFFGWLYKNEKIVRNPLDRMERPRRIAPADLDVVTVSPDDARKLLAVARDSDDWAWKTCLPILCYLGPRRRAVANLRLSDYDRDQGRLRFHEKGGKTIWKPVPDELATILDAAIAAGAIGEPPNDYLVPSRGPVSKKSGRDDRVIWRIVKDVARVAGVDAHVHSLRAAFACYYLEANRGDVEGLKSLLGHRSIQTTEVYLRKLDRAAAMAPVRRLSWAVGESVNGGEAEGSQIAEKRLAVPGSMGAGGFEPPMGALPHQDKEGSRSGGNEA